MVREGNELLSLELTYYCPTAGGKEGEITGERWGRRAGFTSRRWGHRLSEEEEEEKKTRAKKMIHGLERQRQFFSILMFEAVKTNRLSETWSHWNHRSTIFLSHRHTMWKMDDDAALIYIMVMQHSIVIYLLLQSFDFMGHDHLKSNQMVLQTGGPINATTKIKINILYFALSGH